MKKLLTILIFFIAIQCSSQSACYRYVYHAPDSVWLQKCDGSDSILINPRLSTAAGQTGKTPISNGTAWTFVVPFDGAYGTLTGKPTIPTNTNQLTNGAGFLTSYSETDPLSFHTADTGTAFSKYLRVNTAAATYQPVGTYASGSGSASGTNTGDNAANTTYSNVNNTSDANKPVSTAQQTALDLKVNIADTASALSKYLRKQDTLSMLSTYLQATVAAATYAVIAHTHTYSSITSNPATTVGNNLFTLVNPSAIKFIRINADNTVSARAVAELLSDLSLGNVTNESKATMFNNVTFTGTFAAAAGSIGNAALVNAAVANLSGTNTGDNAVNSNYSALVSNATHTGDATGSTALTVVKINGTSLAGLGTGILKNTTGTGVPSIAVAADFPTLNQNTSGTAADLSAVLSYAKGGISASAATSATTGTMTVNMTSSVVTITPTGACTFNASGGVAGQILTFSVTTSGVSAFVLTFGTNFRKTGTLSTGTTSARFFTVTFICLDGTTWSEIARTAVQS